MTLINLTSHPISRPIHGTISVPGDKSISHRSIIFGSIARGTTVVEGFLQGADCLATLAAFRAMGVVIDDSVAHRLQIHGVGKSGLKPPKEVIDCGNSGTSIRLLAGLLAAQPFDSCLTGDESLLKRPMLRISRPLTEMGAIITTQDGKPPLEIRGGQSLHGIDYMMPEASAQVKSSLLLAALYAQGITKITETGISRNHTELMLKAFAYPIKEENKTLIIDGSSECVGTHIRIPGDISSAAFFIVAAAIIPGADVIITGVGINPTRTGLLTILKSMGADINLLNVRFYGEEQVADIHIKYQPLHGIVIPSDLVPLAIDEFPIIFIAAACAKGQTTLSNAKELRFKESDRIHAMAEGLQQLGINACEYEAGIAIEGGLLRGGIVNSRGDHRIAMSFVIAGSVAQGPITVQNCANINTSFPNFVDVANQLAMKIEEVTYYEQ